MRRGRIVKWDSAKGYGFIDQEGGPVFLHRREYLEQHHRPRKGDTISFRMGQDSQGRTCAKEARPVALVSRLSVDEVLILGCLLVVPALAAMKLPFDAWKTFTVLVILSLISSRFYASDKQRASHGAWRISEAKLHFCDLIGGWPGGFLAQRHLRHKVAKPSFQFTFRAIVIFYQLLSLDYLLDWKMWNGFLEGVETVGRLF